MLEFLEEDSHVYLWQSWLSRELTQGSWCTIVIPTGVCLIEELSYLTTSLLGGRWE